MKRLRVSERSSQDITQDYKYQLKEIAADNRLPVERIRIELYPCGEDCIFDSRTGKWLGYVSDYLIV